MSESVEAIGSVTSARQSDVFHQWTLELQRRIAEQAVREASEAQAEEDARQVRDLCQDAVGAAVAGFEQRIFGIRKDKREGSGGNG